MSKLLTLGILQQVQNGQGGKWTLAINDIDYPTGDGLALSNTVTIPKNCTLYFTTSTQPDGVTYYLFKNGDQDGVIINGGAYVTRSYNLNENDTIQIRVYGVVTHSVDVTINLDDSAGRIISEFNVYYNYYKFRCFFTTTKILTVMGSVQAGNVKLGDELITYNHKFGTAKVIDIQYWKGVKTIVVKINELEISPDHPVMTDSGWKQAILVRVGDMLINEQGDFDIVESVEHFNDVRDYIDFQVDREHAYFADGYLITAPRAAFYFDSIKAENESGQLFGVYKERGNHNSELLELRDSADKSGVCYLKTKPAKQYVIQGYKSDKCYFQSIGFIADGNFIEHSKDVVLIEQEKLIIDLDLSNYKNVEFVITGYFDPIFIHS